jgi:polysaccharide deacetylase family protein (PEP-CTERM system associated)
MTIKNLLSVDIEDWFHICGVSERIPKESWPRLESRVFQNTLKLLEILEHHDVKATFFVLGYVAEIHPEVVQQIHAKGHDIATHGYAHQRVYTLTPQAFLQDIRKAVHIISGITNQAVMGYRAPEWSIRDDSLWALEILGQENMAYDSSMAPLPIIGNPNYPKTPYKRELTKGSIWEFPPLVRQTSLTNLPIGGGWGLRVFPYRMIRSEIQRLNQLGHPALVFLHPREFDLDCPRISLPWVKRFVLNARIERTEKRLARLLRDFHFTSIEDFLKTSHHSAH